MKQKQKLYKIEAKYIVPNFVTFIGMTTGLVAILLSFKGHYQPAAWFIVYSVLLDKLDGTVARALKAHSEFGLQMDSFSDLIAFGVAPGILFFSIVSSTGLNNWIYSTYIGIITVFYIACAVLRLAKFNVLTKVVGNEYFLGIPTTSAGAVVSLFYLTFSKYVTHSTVTMIFPALMFFLALFMVSNIKVPKLKKSKNLFLNIFIFSNVVIAYFFGFFCWIWPIPEYLFLITMIYIVVGAAYYLVKDYQKY